MVSNALPRDSKEAPPRLVPWRCEVLSCLNKGRWWRSPYGVILCANCQPPASPGLAVEWGDESRVPWVLESSTRTAWDPTKADRPDRPRSLDDALALGSPVWILRGDRMPEKVEVKGARRKTDLPEDATHWCCEGDLQWTRIVRSER